MTVSISEGVEELDVDVHSDVDVIVIVIVDVDDGWIDAEAELVVLDVALVDLCVVPVAPMSSVEIGVPPSCGTLETSVACFFFHVLDDSEIPVTERGVDIAWVGVLVSFLLLVPEIELAFPTVICFVGTEELLAAEGASGVGEEAAVLVSFCGVFLNEAGPVGAAVLGFWVYGFPGVLEARTIVFEERAVVVW